MITILTGNVLDTLPTLPANGVQCCVTSPPYWGLRSYLPDGHADKGFELGSEPTPEEYVANMVAVFREVKRVLREDGTLWLNLGDSYANSGVSDPSKVGGFTGQRIRDGVKGTMDSRPRAIPAGLKQKDLCGIPWRVAFALQEDGWWLRSEITWCKRAPMPESVADRPTSATEKIFLLTKNSRYFYDAQAVAEQAEQPLGAPELTGQHKRGFLQDLSASTLGSNQGSGTRNQRNFWLLGPEPYAEAHFATFPTEIPRRAILAGTSAHGACPTCGAPWERVVMATAADGRQAIMKGGKAYDADGRPLQGDNMIDHGVRGAWNSGGVVLRRETAGFAPTCTCGHEDTVPCVVLDPFTGSGTTGAVARTLGRDFIGCELNPEYVKLAEKRIGHAQPALFGI